MKKSMIVISLVWLGLSTAVNVQATDTAAVAPTFKLLSHIEDNMYRLVYASGMNERLKISILDTNKDVLYADIMYIKGTLVKPFDLRNLPEGEYTFRITSNSGQYEETVRVKSEWAEIGDKLSIQLLAPNHFQLTSTETIDKLLVMHIYDQNHELVYEEKLDKNSKINKMYNLELVTGKSVSIAIFAQGQKIKEAQITR